VDGLHILDTKKNRGKNEIIRHDIKYSDAVIWQSEFSKKMVSGILNIIPKMDTVIFNGAENRGRSPGKPTCIRIIMSAKWVSDGEVRPHKRLKEMCEIVLEYSTRNEVTCWVAGMADYNPPRPITMLGHLKESALESYLSCADVMLNLCWYDWCPNAVVEAICAGVPVICSNNGGVPEIVKDSGIILDIDKPMVPEYVPPVVPSIMDSRRLVFDALDRVRDGATFNMDRPDLTAKYAAEQYYKLFKKVLE